MKLLKLTSLVIFSGILLNPGVTLMEAAPRSTPPNIIFILADDLGYSDIEPFGQTMFETPSLTRMAKEGIKFTNQYAGGPVCAPSRSSLMTGQHTGNTPVRGNKRNIVEGVQPLSHNVMTIAEMLKAKTDYTTALYGRWHLGGIFSDSQPHQRGFDEFFGALSKYYKPTDTYYRPDLYRNGEEYLLEGNNAGEKNVHREDVITEEALKFIDRQANSGKPFFLYMAYSFAHAPIQPVPGENRYDNREWPQKEIDYAHNISRLDTYVGQFMDKLEDLEMAENTLVIFTSDNGPHKEDGHNADFFDSNGPFKGYKRDLYEGGIREPFIGWWPGKIKPGTSSDHISAFWDLMPTVADLAGIEAPTQTDGISYLPALLGKKQQQHEYLYWEFSNPTPRQAIRMGKWKGIHFIEYDRFELYDLEKDPGESSDLSARYPDIVAELSEGMDEAHTYNVNFPITKAEKFIQVSPRNPRYFQYEDGTPFIPIGQNICWSRTTTDPQKALEQYRRYFKEFAANGGNFVRIWLSAPLFEVETEKPFGYDFQKKMVLHDELVKLAGTYDIKLKFCFENFRRLLNYPPKFEGSVPFDKPIYHVDNGGPLTSMDEYYATDVGKQLFIEKMQFYSNQYGDNPTVFGWELWNEINAVVTADKPTDILEWTKEMLVEAKEIFPRQLVMQTLGSFASDGARDYYREFFEPDDNQVIQVHRYLDPGASFEVCKGAFDVLAADATREMIALGQNKPIIVSEVGAVLAHHAGPSDLYEIDNEGLLLHDGLFAPFFAGAAGSGNFWHWHHYVDKHDLWWHIGRFAEAVKGLNPIVEDFQPLYSESTQTRNYCLQGAHTSITWIRDTASDWQSELIEKRPARPVRELVIPVYELGLPEEVTTVDCYLPWEDSWQTATVRAGSVELPAFKRSIVVKGRF